MNNKKVLVLGSTGLVGSTILRILQSKNYSQLLHPTRQELDLFRQEDVEIYFKKHKPEVIYMAAGMVGGIIANETKPAQFIFENLQIQQNVFNAALINKTPHFLFLGSSCIYPKNAPQPLKEESLLTSPLEETNQAYAVAKIAGVKTVEAFNKEYGFNWFSVMPTNLYGLNDHYNELNSHVIPGLITRMSQAIKNQESEFRIWGSGKPKREFLFVDDLAKSCIYLVETPHKKPSLINIGSGEEVEISQLATMIAKKMGFTGKLVFDSSKPDGTMRKLLDSSKIRALGWTPQMTLDKGLDLVIEAYLKKN